MPPIEFKELTESCRVRLPLEQAAGERLRRCTAVYALFRQSNSEPGSWPYPINSVFNAGAVRLEDGDTLLLCRVESRTGLSHLCAARSANGVDGWRIDPEPTLAGNPREFPEEIWGIEDPRITYVPELEQYAVAYTSFARGGPEFRWPSQKTSRALSALASSCRRRIKTRRCCRAEIGGRWALIHRPVTTLGAHMWISYSPDLRHWGSHKVILEARRGGWWDANKIGLCSPPIETAKRMADDLSRSAADGIGQHLSPGPCALRSGTAEICLQRGDSWMFGPEEHTSAAET